MNKTPWYPKNVKPVRKGWYEVKWCDIFICDGLHYWDGKCWTSGGAWIPQLPWRGLKKKKKEKK